MDTKVQALERILDGNKNWVVCRPDPYRGGLPTVASTMMTPEAPIESRCEALVDLHQTAIFLTSLTSAIIDVVEAGRPEIGEALVALGRGGGVSVDGGAVLAGSRFSFRLRIDDLCPPEALAPGASGYDMTIAAAEESAEHRLIQRLDAIGAGHVAPRRIDMETLEQWVEGHAGGPAEAIRALRGVVEINGITVAEVV